MDDFLTQFWDFYHALLDFKKNPSLDYAILLEQRFDSLFTLAARMIARQRDVSIQTKNKDGTNSRDIFLSIYAAVKKLNVNFYDYLVDRISRKTDAQSLSDLILNSTFA